MCGLSRLVNFQKKRIYEDYENCKLSRWECFCGASVFPQVVGTSISEVDYEHSGMELGTRQEECESD